MIGTDKKFIWVSASTISFLTSVFSSTSNFFLLLSIEDIGISCLKSSPFINAVTRMNSVIFPIYIV